MKIKPTKHSGEVLLEMDRNDEQLLTAASAAAFQLKNILVPIDFSDCSKKALQYALALAKQYGSAVTLLYVVPTFASGEYGGVDYVSLEAEMCSRGQKELSALLVDEVNGKVPANAVVRTGSPTFEIVELATRLPADIIILATHGRTGFKHVLMGSVAEHVVRYAPCPVLVVREREREFVVD